MVPAARWARIARWRNAGPTGAAQNNRRNHREV